MTYDLSAPLFSHFRAVFSFLTRSLVRVLLIFRLSTRRILTRRARLARRMPLMQVISTSRRSSHRSPNLTSRRMVQLHQLPLLQLPQPPPPLHHLPFPSLHSCLWFIPLLRLSWPLILRLPLPCLTISITYLLINIRNTEPPQRRRRLEQHPSCAIYPEKR